MQEARTAPRGVYAGIEQLGLTEATRSVWVERFDALLGLFAKHFEAHDFLLGVRPGSQKQNEISFLLAFF